MRHTGLDVALVAKKLSICFILGDTWDVGEVTCYKGSAVCGSNNCCNFKMEHSYTAICKTTTKNRMKMVFFKLA